MRHQNSMQFRSTTHRPDDLYYLFLPMQVPLILGRGQSFGLAFSVLILITANYLLQCFSTNTMTIGSNELLIQRRVFGIPYFVLCRVRLEQATLEVVQEPLTSKHFMTAKYMQINENVILRGQAIVHSGRRSYLIEQKEWPYYDEILQTLSAVL
jgi:hypothetical protein